jgi:single-strand DNA-binding protein
MTEAVVSFAGNLTDDPELRHTEGGIARARFRVAVSGRREQEASFFTVIVWRNQAEHAARSLAKGSRVVVAGRLQHRSWTAEDGSGRSTVEVVAEELGPSVRWATAIPARSTKRDREERLVWARAGLGGQADQAGEKHEEHEEAAQQQQETAVQVFRRGRVRVVALGHGHLLHRPGCH